MLAVDGIVPFVIIGVTTGSVYGLAAMGLVLTYKTSGIFNFAHGAIGAITAFSFYELNVVRGLPWAVSLAISAVAVPPVLALIMERMTRALAGGSTTTKVVATIGLQLAITSGLVAYYGGASLEFPAFLPTGTFQLAGINVGIDQAISACIAGTAAAGFFVFFKVSSMGVKMRAVVDNPNLLELAGSSAYSVRAWSWLIGCWFAGLSGLLLAPLIGLDAMLLTLLVVQAYGAAAVGYFSSLPLTYAGGLILGVLAAVATKFVTGSEIMAGLPPAMPFLVLFAVLLLLPRNKLVEAGSSHATPQGLPLLSPVGTGLTAVGAVAIAAVLPFVVGPKLPVYAMFLVFVLIFYSLNLLVRTSGQVSLAHAGLVAVGAAAFSHFSVGAGMPWLLAVLFAGAVAVPVGAMVAIPAIRLSGLYLALATYGFALLLEKVAYRTAPMFGTDSTLPAARPTPFADDQAFYYVLLAFAVAAALVVAGIGHSRLGRLLRAMADSPTTLATLGLGVNVTRVTVFAISAFIAGVAGALYASQSLSATSVPFTSYTSLTWLAILVVCASGRAAAPILAAASVAVVPAYITITTLVEWLPVAFGVGALMIATREAASAQHLGRAGHGASEQDVSSRAAERIGSGGPVVERTRAAVMRRAFRDDGGVVGYGVRIAASRGGTR